MDQKELAVCVKNAIFGYKPHVPILKNLSLNIPKGDIFAILGSNGAGKTTLVRTILGCNRLQSGSVQVFGVRPGSKRSDIPGVGVGYMPQDLALFEEFRINEILRYYGSVYHMSNIEINQRIEELIKFLNLPEKERPIRQLSGGQQRRVSIAITLIHRPKLLILDEPTVGVDSMLRHEIWQHLEEICKGYGQTVIIITHYIDEARRAGNVAFLRNGSILQQDNPIKLIQEYNCETLEEVFYRLCKEQQKRRSLASTIKLLEENIGAEEVDNTGDQSRFAIDLKRVSAVLWKDTTVMSRNWILLFVFFFIPLAALITVRYAFARTPEGINMGVFNNDNQEYSQRFIELVDRQYIKLNHYPDQKTAMESVVNGTNYLSFGFQPNFTDNFEFRFRDLNGLTEEEIKLSDIPVYVDFTSPIVMLSGAFLLKAFRDFLVDMSDVFGQNAYKYFHLVHVEESYYGDLYKFSLSDTLDPAIILFETQIVPLIMSALIIINMRRFANFERDLVAGVKQIDILAAHFIQMTVLIVLQALFTMFISFGVVGMRQSGSYLDLFLIIFLFGSLSSAIGISVAVCTKHSIVAAICILFFYELSMLFTSGIFWPVEAIPNYWKELFYFNSFTMPLDSIRAVMIRGFSLDRSVVWIGYMSTFIYTLIINSVNTVIFCMFIDR